MKKKQLLLMLISLFVSSFLAAQGKSDANDERIGNYNIKIVTNPDDSYGYEIYKQNTMLIKQQYKPFIMIPQGFRIPENAKVMAKWHLKQFQMANKKYLSITIGKAKEIGVSDEDLLIK